MKKILSVALCAILGGCTVNSDGNSTEQVGEAAQAVSSSVSATFTLNADKTVTVKTGDMPKGWYTQAGTANYSKSPITVSWNADVTGCNATPASGSYGSGSKGTFTLLSPPGYTWSATSNDLVGLENHWHKYIHCDGSTTVVGCPDARTIDYTLSVGGACLSGGGTCTASGSVSLPAIHDMDVIEPESNCATDCESVLGACISGCEGDGANGDSNCSRCCECRCKAMHRECGAPQWNCYEQKHDGSVCLPTAGPSIIQSTTDLQ